MLKFLLVFQTRLIFKTWILLKHMTLTLQRPRVLETQSMLKTRLVFENLWITSRFLLVLTTVVSYGKVQNAFNL